MEKIIMLSIISLLLGLSLPLHAAPVSVTLYQEGYIEGAYVTVSFTGDDVIGDNNGQLSLGELSAFTMRFTGNSLVASFSLSLADLGGFIYDLDGGPLGDGIVLGIEGIAAGDGTFNYVAGPGPMAVCGIGIDCAFVAGALNQDFSQRLLVDTHPPVSAPTLSEWSLILLALMLGLIGLKSPIIKREI